jgi:hypothetical protein
VVAGLFLVWLAVSIAVVAAWPRLDRFRRPVLAGVLALSAAHQLMFGTLAEDAFISFRYAENFVAGNGLVFSVGERVEGYSNFLWILLIAAPRAVFGADLVGTARVFGVLCALGCVLAGYALTRRLTGSAPAGILAATLVAAASGLAAYGPSGLETPLFTLLVLLVLTAVAADRPVLAGVLVALATMTRPDGAVVAVLVGGWLLVRAVRQREWLAPLWFLTGATVLVVPWTVWRVTYYGHLVPNALAAKSGAPVGWLLQSGLTYLVGFVIATQVVLVLLPVAGFALLRRRAAGGSAGVDGLVLLVAVGYVAFFVATGGDWMPAWRFFAPVVPLLVVGCVAIAAESVTDMLPARGRLAPMLTASVAGLLLVTSVWQPSYKPTIDYWHAEVDDLAHVGTWVRDAVPPGTVIATFANGALSYSAGPKVTVVDLLGLTDEHIARAGERDPGGMIGHQAQDPEYVTRVRRPALIFTSGLGYATTPECGTPDPRYAPRYRPALFRVAGAHRWVVVLLRRDAQDTLRRQLDQAPSHDFVRWCPDRPDPSPLAVVR